ncbi:hypothetical protein T439DRAFT_313138 [Meredithblackwellia eburnea MCA 4105]
MSARSSTSSSMLAFTFFLFFLRFASVSAQVFNCIGGSVYVVAHADDDLLFQSPDIYTDVTAGNCITTIFLTAGDAGIGSTYRAARESGNEAATATMAGVPDSYTEFNATFGGQAVTIRTLVGAPQIQKVWFRLPDGDVDGSGYAATGYETLRELYFGSIQSITNQPGTATYTLATLKLAISQILTARQPSFVRTLDYLSDYDAGDHSDHLTTARITAGLVGTYATNASFSGYMGYPVANLAPTLATTSALFKGKSAAFFAYTPYDSGECQSYSACVSAGRGEASWLIRQYVVTPALAQYTSLGSAQTPVDLPTGNNVALLATATASSQTSDQPASGANDGYIQGYPGNSTSEWSSNGGGAGTKLLISWTQTYNISSVILYDRPNQYDQITSGNLTFSDGTVVNFGALPNDGSAYIVLLPQAYISASYILMTVSTVSSTTSNVGLSEFQALGVLCTSCSTNTQAVKIMQGSVTGAPIVANWQNDVALLATATASSKEEDDSGGEKAIDGVVDGYPNDESKEWASSAQGVGAWLQLNWTQPYTLQSLVFYDRINSDDWVKGGTVTFSDGSTITIPALTNSGVATPFNFAAVTTTSLRFVVTAVGPTTGAVGLAELAAYTSKWTASTATTLTVKKPAVSSSSSAKASSTSSVKSSSASSSKTSSSSISSSAKISSSSSASSSVKSSVPASSASSSVSSASLSASSSASSASASATSSLASSTSVSASQSQSSSSVMASSSSASASSSSASGSSASNSAVSNSSGSASSSGSVSQSSAQSSGSQSSSASSSAASSSASSASAASNSGVSSSVVSSSAQFSSAQSSSAQTSSSASSSVQAISSSASSSSSVVSSSSATSSSSQILSSSSAVPSSSSSALLSSSSIRSSSASSSLLPSSSSMVTSIRSSSASSTASSSAASASSTAAYSTINLAFDATVKASTQDIGDDSLAVRATDGLIGGYTEDGSGDQTLEWSSDHQGAGAKLTLTWASTVQIAKVVLYDRPNLADQCTGATLTFSDGTVVKVGSLPNDGSPLVVTFPQVSTKTLVFTVTSVSSTTSSVGLAEIQCFGLVGSSTANGLSALNLARYNVVATASSFGYQQNAYKAIDGLVGGYVSSSSGDYTQEWATNGQGAGAWLLLTWSSPVIITSVQLFDRPNTSDRVMGGTLVTSGGTSMTVGNLVNNGATATTVTFNNVQTTSLLFTVTSVSSTTGNVGLSEIKVFGSFA